MRENKTEKTGIIYGINGPIVYLKEDAGFMMNEMVYVGPERLVGEVIGLTSERTTIQVYEETTGIRLRYRGAGVRDPGAGDPHQYF